MQALRQHAGTSFAGLKQPLAAQKAQAAKLKAQRVVRLHAVRAVSEKERVVEQFSRLASDAASSLQQVATQTEKALSSLADKDALQRQTEATAAELRAQAELLKAQALEATSRLTGILARTEEERNALLRNGNAAAIFSAAGQLRTQTLSNVSVLLQEAERNKPIILAAVKDAPEPIREIAETAVAAHSPDKAKKGAVIHDFCLGITYGGLLVLGGLFWFIVSGSINAIRFGVLLGSVVLAAGVGSLKAWQAGKSSTPYIAAQAVTAYAIFAAQTARYSQTGAIFPTGIAAVSSIAMVAFYIYVVLAGGNPPSKKASGNPPADAAPA